MTLQKLADVVVAEGKTLADDLKAAATGQFATTVESYLPSLTPFLKALATEAGAASGLLALVPVAETLISVAQHFGAKPMDANEMAAEDEKFHEGMSAD